MEIFRNYKLNKHGVEKYERIKMIYESAYAELLKYATGDERCKSLMLTHLEQSAMWAQKAMARDPKNQHRDENV